MIIKIGYIFYEIMKFSYKNKKLSSIIRKLSYKMRRLSFTKFCKIKHSKLGNC